MPVRLVTVGALIATLVVLGITDAAGGIVLPVYFWTVGGIVLLGLFVGATLRRTPWSLSALLVPVVAGLVAFGGSGASLHDGTGQRDWTPTSASAVASSYRLAFGQGVLDLRHVGPLDRGRTIDVTMASGQVRVLLPKSMNATVNATVHIGVVSVDGNDLSSCGSGFPCGDGDHGSRGWNVNRVVLPPDGATGPAVTIDVHLADGNVDIQRS
jgi:hypothetical protein